MTLPTSLLSSARACLEELSRRRPTREEARAIRLLVAPPKQRRAVKASRKRREGKRSERNERMAEIRAGMLPAGATACAIAFCNFAAEHIHHVVSGNGNRQEHEAVDTVAPLCHWHHRRIHKGSQITLHALLVWAQGHASAKAVAALEHRIDKIREARASHPRKEEGR